MAFVKKLAWFGVTILSAVLCFGQTFTVVSTTQQLDPTHRGSVSTYWPDGNMGAIFHGGTNYVFSMTNNPGEVQVTVPNLNTWSSGLSVVNPATNLQFASSSNAFDYNYIGGQAVYYDSTSGYLIMLYHGENWGGCPSNCSASYAALGLAYSTDFGNTWHKVGEVVSPQAARGSGGSTCQADIGTGTLLVVGSYFYTYYPETPTGCTNGEQLAVARASITSVITQVQNPSSFPTSGPSTLFMKYTGSGTWTGNGVTDIANPQNGGGAFTTIAPYPSFNGHGYYVPNVRYDSYLNQYVLTYTDFFNIALATSPDGLTWNNFQNVATGGAVPPNAYSYPSLLNTSGGDPQVLGQNFSVFYVYPFGTWSNSSLYSVAISVSGGSSASAPIFNPPSPYTGPATTVTISDSTPSPTIASCTSNSGTCTPSTTYTTGINFTSSGPTNICAFANAAGYTQSPTACWTGTYPTANPPSASPAVGSYTSPQNVALSDSTPGSTITYCTDTTNSCTPSTTYSSPIHVSAPLTYIRAYATATGYLQSLTVSLPYNISGSPTTPAYVQAVAAPGVYSANPSTTIPITSTAGDTLTLWVVSEGTITSFNAPTASGLTFTSQGTSIGSWAQGIWTASVPTTGSYTINISANASSTEELTGIAVETSGTTTSGIVLSGFGATSGCPSCVGSTLTTTSANSMVLTFLGYGYGPGLTVSSSSPFALTSVNGDDSIGQYRGAGYYVQSSAGLYSPTWTTSNYPTMPNVSVALAPSSGSTVTGVSVSCSPTSITTSQTSSCSATVTGTGSPSQAVTWSVSSGSGSVNSSGLFTPSGTGTSTIKATSVQNTSYAGTANVSVTSSGGGSPAYVQAVAAPGVYSANPSTTIPITSTAGDTLTLWVVSEGTITSFNAPTASGLTFTSQGTSIGSWAQGIWTASVPTTGSYTINISANASSTEELTGIAVETSGTTTSGIVLSGFGATSGCPSCVGSTLTTTSANSMVLTFLGYGYGPGLTVSSSSPFALTSVNGDDSIGQYRGAGYYVQSSAGLYSPTWTTSNYPTMPNVSVALAPSSGSTVTGVSVSCSPTSITTSQTSSCSATVTGTGSPSQAVTWSVSSGSGSVNSSGLFTPSGTGTSTIKATSVQNTSYAGTANVSVTSSGGGSPAYVQAVAAPGVYSANPSTTIPITSTAGDTLTLWVVSEGTITSFNAPTASGLTFTSQGTSIGSWAQGIWTASVPTTGSYTINISANASSTEELTGIAVETSGTTTSGIVLSGFGATSGCPSCVGSTLTTTSANSMVLTFLGYGYGPGLTVSSSSPFALTSVNGDDSIGQYRGAGYYVQSSAGLYSPTWTTSNYPTMPNVSVALAP